MEKFRETLNQFVKKSKTKDVQERFVIIFSNPCSTLNSGEQSESKSVKRKKRSFFVTLYSRSPY